MAPYFVRPSLYELVRSLALLLCTMAPVRVALLGGGIFARDAYLPILKGSSEVELVAIWSRSEQTVSNVLPTARE